MNFGFWGACEVPAASCELKKTSVATKAHRSAWRVTFGRGIQITGGGYRRYRNCISALLRR